MKTIRDYLILIIDIDAPAKTKLISYGLLGFLCPLKIWKKI